MTAHKTLAAMIAAHTDTALEALASKGALRRAMRDLDKGKASIESRDDTSAEITADGQTVKMSAEGPAAATCTCPAQGVCRHRLLAVLALRDAGDDADVEQTSAVDFLSSLDGAAIEKFAGADWSRVVSLALEPGATDIKADGPNVTVAIDDLDASVTFISDQRLRDAVYKGKKTLQRVCVALAALLVRSANGIAVDASEAVAQTTVSNEFLDRAQREILAAVSAVLPARSAAAQDMFLDLAVSSRVETLPRLSSELRALEAQARLAVSRDVGFEPDRFLKTASRTHALLEALRADPGNAVYTGTVRRDFADQPDFHAWPLGAAQWRFESGARGLTLHAWSPTDARWYSASDGRARGMDPSFDPRNVYSGPLWGAGTVAELVGSKVTISAVRVSDDGAVSMAMPKGAKGTQTRLSIDELIGADCSHHMWADLRLDLGERFGRGLKRRPLPQPAVIVPAGFGDLGFNDLGQVYEWEVQDIAKDRLLLTIDGHDHETALQLHRSSRRIDAILVEATIGAHGVVYRPVTVFSTHKKQSEVRNLDFDDWPFQRRAKVRDLMDRIGAFLKPASDITPMPDPLERIVADATDALVAAAAQTPHTGFDALRSRCEAAGLLVLAEALNKAEQDPSMATALRGAYLASEVESALWLDAG